MTIVRFLIPGLSALMGIWVVLSFAGVMFNPGNAGFWTTSLVSALLASVLVMPVLVIVHHATSQRDARPTARPAPSFSTESPDLIDPTPQSSDSSPSRREPASGQ